MSRLCPLRAPVSRLAPHLAPGLFLLALVAWCNPARAGSECPDPSHADAVAAMAPAGLGCVPYDPLTFVGPPVPLAILFAPTRPGALPPARAGLRYEIEAPPAPATPTAGMRAAGAPGLLMLWDAEAQARIRETRLPGGGWTIDLAGVYLDLARVTLDPEGRPVLDCVRDAHAPTPRPRARGGRE